jgi:anti-anti-sigma factor
MTIALSPDGTGDCSRPLREALRESDDATVVINLERVPYLSSSALAELAQYHRKHRDREIILVHASALVMRTLNVVGMNKLFTIRPAA